MNRFEIVTPGTRAQELLYSVCKQHPTECAKQIDTISTFKNIVQQLAHCIGAEERWQARLRHQSPDLSYEATANLDLDKLYKDWTRIRQETVSVLKSGGENMLSEVFDVHLVRWSLNVDMTGEQIMYHIISHESYHRGQCSFLLQMFGIDPPNFDIPFMLKY